MFQADNLEKAAQAIDLCTHFANSALSHYADTEFFMAQVNEKGLIKFAIPTTGLVTKNAEIMGSLLDRLENSGLINPLDVDNYLKEQYAEHPERLRNQDIVTPKLLQNGSHKKEPIALSPEVKIDLKNGELVIETGKTPEEITKLVDFDVPNMMKQELRDAEYIIEQKMAWRRGNALRNKILQ